MDDKSVGVRKHLTLARSVAGRAQVCSSEGSVSTSVLLFRQCPNYVTTHSGANLELVLQFTALSEDKCLDRNLPTEITLRLKNAPFLRPGLKKFKTGSNDNDRYGVCTVHSAVLSATRTEHIAEYTHHNYDILPHHRITYNEVVIFLPNLNLI